MNEQKWNHKMSFYDNFLNRKRLRKEERKKKHTIPVFLFVFRFSFVHCIISHLFHIIWGQKNNSYRWFPCAFCILKVTHQMNWRWWARLKYYYESQSNRNFNGSIQISSWWMLILTIPFPYFFCIMHLFLLLFIVITDNEVDFFSDIIFRDFFNADLLNTLLFISWNCWKLLLKAIKSTTEPFFLSTPKNHWYREISLGTTNKIRVNQRGEKKTVQNNVLIQ